MTEPKSLQDYYKADAKQARFDDLWRQDYYKTNPKPTVDICRETPYYFAYGMNTEPGAMMTRTGDAVAKGRCMLRNHAFRFAGCADVYPREGVNTVGVLWELTDTQFVALDAREGYPYYYDRKIVDVECNGQMYRAWMYYMTPGHETYEPSKGYYDMLVRGYDTFAVDKTQIEQALKQATVAAVVSKLTAEEYKRRRTDIAYATVDYTKVKYKRKKLRRAKDRTRDPRIFKNYTTMLFYATSKYEFNGIKAEARLDGLSLETVAREYIEGGWVRVPDHWEVHFINRSYKH